MILREADWQKIRENFTPVEKDIIRSAIDGEIICPRGWSIDTSKLPIGLEARLKVLS